MRKEKGLFIRSIGIKIISVIAAFLITGALTTTGVFADTAADTDLFEYGPLELSDSVKNSVKNCVKNLPGIDIENGKLPGFELTEEEINAGYKLGAVKGFKKGKFKATLEPKDFKTEWTDSKGQKYKICAIATGAFCEPDDDYDYEHHLISVELPENIVIVDERAFQNNFSFPDEYAPSDYIRADLPGVRIIGDSAFSCGYYQGSQENRIREITIPEATYIGIYAFKNCVWLKEIQMQKVQVIKSGAFFNCGALTSINLPHIKYIESIPFYYCNALESVTLSGDLEKFGYVPANDEAKVQEGYCNPFAYCLKLSSIKVEPGESPGNGQYSSKDKNGNECYAVIQRTEDEGNILVSGCNKTIIPKDVTIIRTDAFYYDVWIDKDNETYFNGLSNPFVIPSSVELIEKETERAEKRGAFGGVHANGAILFENINPNLELGDIPKYNGKIVFKCDEKNDEACEAVQKAIDTLKSFGYKTGSERIFFYVPDWMYESCPKEETKDGKTYIYKKYSEYAPVDLTFNNNGHGDGEASKKVTWGKGTKLNSDYMVPSDNRYDFEGWYKEADCTNKWDHSTGFVNENTILYAKWTEHKQTVKADNVTLTYNEKGRRITPSIEHVGKPEELGQLSYAAKDEESGKVIEVNSTTGELTTKKVGTASVVVTVSENAYYPMATKEVNVTVEARKIADCDFDIEKDSFIADGEEKTINISLTDQKIKLEEGKDYDLSGDVSATNPGTYTAKVTGKGNYTGEKIFNWEIKTANIDEKPVEPDEQDIPDQDEKEKEGLYIIVAKSKEADGKYHYDGSAKLPTVIVYDGGKKLEENLDYILKYANNINAYTLTKDSEGFSESKAPSIKVTFKGNYSGTETQYFTIEPVSLSESGFGVNEDINISHIALPFKGKPVTPKVSLYYKGKALTAGKDYSYEIFEKEDSGFTKSLGNTVESEGDYVVRFIGKNNYSATKIADLKVKSNLKDINKLSFSKVVNKEYSGEEIKQTIVITDKTVSNSPYTLELNKDYTVGYNNNINIGTASVVINGLGDYCGTKKLTFKITGTSIGNVTVEGIPSSKDPAIYTGEPVELASLLVKTNDARLLIKDKDYTVEYRNNIKPGTASIIITGKGAYSGTVKKTFKIAAFDIGKDYEKTDSERRIQINVQKSVFYTKSGAKPEVLVTYKDINGKTQVLDENDIKITYKNNKKLANTDSIEANKAPTVIITGKGCYKGSVRVTFSIVEKDLVNTTLTLKDKVFTDKAGKYQTNITVTDTDGKKLTAGKDYEKNAEYSYQSVTLVKVNGENVERQAGDAVQNTDIIPKNTTINVTVKAREGGFYKGSISGSFRITEKSITSAKLAMKTQQYYTGKEITPGTDDFTLTIKEGGKQVTLTPYNEVTGEGDYVIEGYKNNIKVGKASIVIKGVGNYGGKVNGIFFIKQKGR